MVNAPYGHWRTTIFVAALRQNGIATPKTHNGSMNGETLLQVDSLCTKTVTYPPRVAKFRPSCPYSIETSACPLRLTMQPSSTTTFGSTSV